MERRFGSGVPPPASDAIASSSTRITLLASAFTWNGWTTICTGAGSLVGTWAMFYLRGTALRMAMVLVAALWMYTAWAYSAVWQMIANFAAGGAALLGAWRTRRRVA